MKKGPDKETFITRSSAAEYLTFITAKGEGGVEAIYADEDVWLSQKMMAVPYDVDVRTINYHLQKVFKDCELEEESVIRKFRITAADGKNYDTGHYNLSAIIAIGYKVNSERAVQFRKWSATVVKEGSSAIWRVLALVSFDVAKLYFGRGNVTTIPNLSQSKLAELPMALPPLSEQKKIAHILSTVQRAVEAQERIIQTTTELKKALMHKLFTEGLRNEPQKQTEIGPVPENWKLVPFDKFVTLQRGYDLRKQDFRKGEMPCNTGDRLSRHRECEGTGCHRRPKWIIRRKAPVHCRRFLGSQRPALCEGLPRERAEIRLLQNPGTRPHSIPPRSGCSDTQQEHL